ncbi:MAG: nitroreductase family protein [Bacteroidales bacterium]|nr:nitroreductase family protein [Bacteroidales bacterium]
MDLLAFLESRATVRQYSDKEVSKELINRLLDVAGHASTTGNMQLYSVVVTRDAEKKKALAPTHFNQPTFTNAPVAITFCADFNRFVKWCEESGAEPGYDNEFSFFTAAIDTLLLAQTFAIAAESEGLGICYLGTTTYTAESISKILNLPKRVVPITTITVGYPKSKPTKTDRIASTSWIHEEEYKDYSAEDIKKIFGYKDEMESNKKFIAENNKKSLAQVFTDIRYTKKDNEAMSKSFFDFVRKQFFCE